MIRRLRLDDAEAVHGAHRRAFRWLMFFMLAFSGGFFVQWAAPGEGVPLFWVVALFAALGLPVVVAGLRYAYLTGVLDGRRVGYRAGFDVGQRVLIDRAVAAEVVATTGPLDEIAG